HLRTVEHAADDNRIVSRIVMPKAVAGVIAAPSHVRPGEQAVEVPRVQGFENRLQIVNPAARRFDPLATTHLSYQVRLGSDLTTRYVSSITSSMHALNGLAIHLGQEDVSNGAQHRFRRSFQQVGKTDEKFAVAQANGVVHEDTY